MADETTIVLGAGCFWSVEDALARRPGVTSTRAGYAGGTVANPSYEEVCSGRTGHAEVVRVSYRGGDATLEDLLRFFWSSHVATDRFNDQYRSVVGCSTGQLPTVHAIKTEIEATLTKVPITTEILVEAPFYEADEYHQRYYEKGRETIEEVRRQCGLPRRRDGRQLTANQTCHGKR